MNAAAAKAMAATTLPAHIHMLLRRCVDVFRGRFSKTFPV
jgi:hypothetical protein